MNLETSEIILKDLKRLSWAETLGSLNDVYIPLVRSDNICKKQKVSWASSLTLSRKPFVLTFTEQQAALKSLLSVSNNDLDDCTPKLQLFLP